MSSIVVSESTQVLLNLGVCSTRPFGGGPVHNGRVLLNLHDDQIHEVACQVAGNKVLDVAFKQDDPDGENLLTNRLQKVDSSIGVPIRWHFPDPDTQEIRYDFVERDDSHTPVFVYRYEQPEYFKIPIGTDPSPPIDMTQAA